MLSCAIIVINYKQPELTIDTINNLLCLNHPDFSYHIYLVDNGSADISKEKFSKLYSHHQNVTFIPSDHNTGFASGNNLAIKIARQDCDYDYYLLANNDIFTDADFLSHLISYSQSHPAVGIVGPKIYFYPGFEYHQSRYHQDDLGLVLWSAGGRIDWNNISGTNIGIDELDIGQYDAPAKVDFISGCVLLIKKDVINRIGLLDDRYFMYLEDADFCQRAFKSNFEVHYLPSSQVWHLNSGSSAPGSDIHNYFLTRNRLLFARNFASFKTFFAVVRQSLLVLLKDPSVWRKKAVVDYFLNRFGKGSWK